MVRRFFRASVIVFALAAVVRAFDAAFTAARWSHAAVPPDSLIHYNMLLDWFRLGDTPRGFTLTPSPYLIDIALQMPLVLLAPDFECFAYLLALVYAVLIFGSLYAVLTIVFCGDRITAVLAAALTVIGFYSLAPFGLILHSFIYNHTSEVFSALALVALVHVLFGRPGQRNRYAVAVYAIAVTALMMSSPFFIATYCVPMAIALASIVDTEQVRWRRLAVFLGITAAGAVIALIALALVGRYFWPVRADRFPRTFWQAYRAFKHTVFINPRLRHISWAAMVALVGYTALAIIGWWRRWLPQLRFLLAFAPAVMLSCILLPLKRGGFSGEYELRYMQLTWLATCAFYAVAAVCLVRHLVRRMVSDRRPADAQRWAVAAAAALAAGAIALFASANGPLSLFDPASTTGPAMRCFVDADRSGTLQDGVATTWMARYFTAARLGSSDSSHVVVQISPDGQPIIDPHENNLAWFNHGYRNGRGTLNFLVTHGFDERALRAWRERLGVPDRTISCPAPSDILPQLGPSFELWIWDREDVQHKLAEFVTHDNMRSPFAPLNGATSMAIDLVWGMQAEPKDGSLSDRRREWRRGIHRDGGTLASTRPLFVPSGRYRLELDLSTIAQAGSTRPVAEVVIAMDYHPRVERFPIAAGVQHAVLEVDIDRVGDAVSGDNVSISLVAGAAESIDLTAMTLTALSLRGISPFQIFR
jgi:hypothetical protein